MNKFARRKYNQFGPDKNEMYIDGTIVLFDREDYELIKERKWRIASNGYVVTSQNIPNRKNPILVYMHREVMNTPKNLTVNHKNGCRTDNRKCNLENIPLDFHAHLNTKHKTLTGIKGLTLWKSGLYAVHCAGKYYGKYEDPIEAAKVYDKVAIKHFGRKALTNKKLGII